MQARCRPSFAFTVACNARATLLLRGLVRIVIRSLDAGNSRNFLRKVAMSRHMSKLSEED